MRKKNKRRTEPCQFCGYPISQIHHALPFHIYGENLCTLNLCANCHELYHIVERTYLNPDSSSRKLVKAFTMKYGSEDNRIKMVYHFMAAALNLVNGHIDE